MNLYYIIRNYPLGYYPAQADTNPNTGEIEVTCHVSEAEMIKDALKRHNFSILSEEVHNEIGIIVKKAGKEIREYKPDIILLNVGKEKLEDVSFALDSVSKTFRPHGNS